MSFDAEKVCELLDEVELVPAHGPGPLGWVYFIICVGVPHVKIGFTKGDPQKRLKSLQTGASSELVMLAKHPGTPETERLLHEKFKDSRLQGEWFELTDELHAYMVQAVWAVSEFTIRQGRKLEPWMTAGVQLTVESLGCCSEGLLEALGVPDE